MNAELRDVSALGAVRGVARLAFDAVEKTTELVEAIHAQLAMAGLFARLRPARLRGISGFVYKSIRAVNGGIGKGVDVALAPLATLPRRTSPAPAEEAARAILNGVLGDYLVATRNPLAVTMRFRRHGCPLVLDGDALARAIPGATARIVVLVHGLCMNDLQWRRDDHDHGAGLAGDLGYTPVYLHYNTGRHVSVNGRELATLLDGLVRGWPVPVDELALVGHSMGGLVARSACHYGREAGYGWVARLRKLVFLATPHHGTPLERGGSRLQGFVGRMPYAAPLARLGMIRSAGVTDLRYGNLVDDDWQHGDRFDTSGDMRLILPLPEGVECFAAAATLGARPGDVKDRLLGDGLVPRASALGEHPLAARALAFPPDQRWVGYGMNHFHVLDRWPYAQIRRWLGGS